MKNSIRLTGLLALLLLTGNSALAMFAAPPDEIWGKSDNGQYEFRRDNTTGTLTIYKTGDRESALWKAVLPDFSSLFSVTLLSDSGNTLIHLRGNQQVKTLKDTAVQVAKKDGSMAILPAETFIDELSKPNGPMLGSSPRFLWLSSFGDFDDTQFSLTNANGDKKEILLKDLDFKPES